MKKKQMLFRIVLGLILSFSISSQAVAQKGKKIQNVDSVENSITDCSCKVFPYWFCDENNHKWEAWCTDDPYVNGPPNSTGNIWTPIKAGSISYCIKPYFTQFNSGKVSDDSGIHPGIVLDTGTPPFNSSYPFSVGWIFKEGPNTIYPPIKANDIEAKWNEAIKLVGDQMLDDSCMTLSQSCCIAVIFETDRFFYVDRGIHPDTGTLGYVDDLPWNEQNCQRECNGLKIYINCTTDFLYGRDTIPDTSYLPDHLIRGYVWDNGYNFPPSGTFNSGPWVDFWGVWHESDGVNMSAAYDIETVIEHEMGHIIGLPDRGDPTCINGGGKPCSSDGENNSVMQPLPNGVSRQTFSKDDNCWLAKLYCPNAVPPCKATHHGSGGAGQGAVTPMQDYDITLEQSYPNPTTGAATIAFSINQNAIVTLELYDVLGKRVLPLAENKREDAGRHTLEIPKGALPSGKYIYSLRAGGVVLSKEMMVIK